MYFFLLIKGDGKKKKKCFFVFHYVYILLEFSELNHCWFLFVVSMVKKKKNDAVNMRSIIVNELYKPVRVNYETRRIEVRGYSDLICVDLGDMSKLRKFNQGYAYFLLAVNAFSRKIYTEPLKNKTTREVSDAMLRILDRAKTKFKHLTSDRGKEFFSNIFKNEVLKPNKINHYSTYSGRKSSLAEIYIKHLKVLIYKHMDLQGTNNWVNMLQKLTEIINNRKHSKFNFIPNKIRKKDEKKIMKNIYGKPRPLAKNIRFKIGDQVRISNPPNLFRRAFKSYWSTELYTIRAINIKHPVVYILADFEGNIIPKKFYQEELQKTAAPNHWLVEKVLKTKGNKILVQYFGFGPEYNEWVDKNQFYDVEEESV